MHVCPSSSRLALSASRQHLNIFIRVKSVLKVKCIEQFMQLLIARHNWAPSHTHTNHTSNKHIVVHRTCCSSHIVSHVSNYSFDILRSIDYIMDVYASLCPCPAIDSFIIHCVYFYLVRHFEDKKQMVIITYSLTVIWAQSGNRIRTRAQSVIYL